ncbi:MAG: hypothetical protein KIT80_14585 [Chitinophagaceae bacterium]|nr:hypothetical protein [Chitinophagaceae bacterium]MCW5928141.1 hypothetical protein [Chitinophagaceae bacterium]
MIHKIIISFCLLWLTSCRDRSTGTPKALDNKKSTLEIVSKRGYDDLIESLYAELVNKDAGLKRLEEDIKELKQQEADSTTAFTQFSDRNRAYYNSANNHLGAISDSLVRDRLKEIMKTHLENYRSLVAAHQRLIDTIEYNRMAIADLHIYLKLFKTLPLIEQYQQNRLPDTTSLEGLIKEQKSIRSYADSLIKYGMPGREN